MKNWLTYPKRKVKIPSEIMANDSLDDCEKFILSLLIHSSNTKNEIKVSTEGVTPPYNDVILELKNKNFIKEKSVDKYTVFKINKEKILDDYKSYLAKVNDNRNEINKLNISKKKINKILNYSNNLQKKRFRFFQMFPEGYLFDEKYAKISVSDERQSDNTINGTYKRRNRQTPSAEKRIIKLLRFTNNLHKKDLDFKKLKIFQLNLRRRLVFFRERSEQEKREQSELKKTPEVLLNKLSTKSTNQLITKSANRDNCVQILDQSLIKNKKIKKSRQTARSSLRKNENLSSKDLIKPLFKSSLLGNKNRQLNKKIYILPNSIEYNILNTFYGISASITKHRSLSSKTAHNIAKSIKELRLGTFTSKKKWNIEWLNENKIPQNKFYSDKINAREILRTINGPIKNLYSFDYWPPNKNTLPKTFLNLLYNPGTGKSFFFLAYYTEIKKKNEFLDKFPKITEYLIQQKIIDFNQINWYMYNQHIQKLSDFFDNNVAKDNRVSYTLYQSSFGHFIAHYVNFLLGKDTQLITPNIRNINFKLLNIDFWVFQKYVESINEVYGRIIK